MNSKWIKQDGIFYPVGDFKTYQTPGPDVFTIYKDERTGRIGLSKYSDNFSFSYKLYDLGIDSFNSMIKSVWNSEYFSKKNQNLGVVFNGLKGSGKTVAAKLLCNSLDIPVILVTDYFNGIIEFIGMLDFECVILIDEAEKTFNENDHKASHALLKMIDGVMNKCRKLYILTTNTLRVNDNLINRPGRIRYIRNVNGIANEAVVEYIKDNLIVTDKLDDVTSLLLKLKINTIDIIKCIIDEVNITGSLDGLKYLNLSLRDQNYLILKFDPSSRSMKDFEAGLDFLRELNLSNSDFSRWLSLSRDDGTQELLKYDKTNAFLLLEEYGIECNYRTFELLDIKVGNEFGNNYIVTNELVDGWYSITSIQNKSNVVFIKPLELINEQPDPIPQNCCRGKLISSEDRINDYIEEEPRSCLSL